MAKNMLLLNTDLHPDDEYGLPNKILFFHMEGGGPANLLRSGSGKQSFRAP